MSALRLLQGQTGSQLIINTGVGVVSGVAGGTAARYAGKLVGNIASTFTGATFLMAHFKGLCMGQSTMLPF